MIGNQSVSEECDRDETTSETCRATKSFGDNVLPDKSERMYKRCYEQFVVWQNEQNNTSVSEDTMLLYFTLMSKKFKPSSLWAKYSMLKSTILNFRNVNIGNYYRLTAFLSKNCKGFRPTKSKTLESKEVERFLSEAPDDRYLAIKVALILGVTGGCRREELRNITVHDIEHYDNMIVVKIPRAKNEVPRKFIVDGEFYKIVRRYEELRPKNVKSDQFFLSLRNGKCTQQVIGINTFGAMPKLIAKYLGLPQPERYTGHSFRRTSASMLADTGADFRTLKRQRERKLDDIPQGFDFACLRWNSYYSSMQSSFASLLDSEQFVDVTLACEGRSLKCHKVILSSCSDYLAALLRDNPCQHPIILMNDLKFWEVKALVKFMYQGEINVARADLPQLLNAAKALQIKGLEGPTPSLQNPRPPEFVPQPKPSAPSSAAPSARLATEFKESGQPSASSREVTPTGSKRSQKRQSTEPPEPRPFTKIRLQRPVTPTQADPTIKLEPLEVPLSPPGIFPDHPDEDHSIASNSDNLEMALHQDEDRGSDDDDMNFCDVPGPPDDLNDADDPIDFAPTDFLEQDQDIVDEGEGDLSENSDEDDIDEDEGDENENEDKPPDNRKLSEESDDPGSNTKSGNADKRL